MSAPAAPPKKPFPLWIALGVAVVAGVAVAAFLVFGGDESGGVPDSLDVPRAFAADPQPFRVELTWKQTEGAQGYTVFRDGEKLGDVGANASSFVDETVQPRQRFTYEIRAFAADVTSKRGKVSVKTPAAPLGQSRVNGLYRVVAHATSNFGFVAFNRDFRTGWRFRPRCGEGPCDVAWNDVNVAGFSSVLTVKGPSYSGQDQANFGRCGSKATTATWTIRFRVTKAATVKGEWRATALDGTIVQRSPAQLGCVATGADYDIKGTLAR